MEEGIRYLTALKENYRTVDATNRPWREVCGFDPLFVRTILGAQRDRNTRTFYSRITCTQEMVYTPRPEVTSTSMDMRWSSWDFHPTPALSSTTTQGRRGYMRQPSQESNLGARIRDGSRGLHSIRMVMSTRSIHTSPPRWCTT